MEYQLQRCSSREAFSATVNGGYLLRPTLLKRDGVAPVESVLSEKTSKIVRDMLVDVTGSEIGTAKLAAIPGISISGKTGTAQKVAHNGRGYDPDRVYSSFVGFVDGNQIGVSRRLTMVVVVDEPGVKPRWGGVVAAPIFRTSMERILTHMMTTDSETLQTAFSGRSFAPTQLRCLRL